MDSPEPLLEAIDADPSDLDARRVLGDWYATHGDPLGELIAVQVALLDARGDDAAPLLAREEELFRQHRDRFFGPLHPRARGRGARVKWFAGSWQSVELEDPLADLGGVLGHPLARWLTGLSARQVLPLHRLELATVRQLALESLDQQTQVLPNGRLQPRLGSFRFEGAAVRLNEPPPLGLSQLRLKGRPRGAYGVNSLSGVDEVARTPWPVLLRLALEAVVADGTVVALLDSERFPRLTHLRAQVLGPGAWDALAAAERPPPLRQLELFDPNLRRGNCLEWVSRAYPQLSGVGELKLLGSGCAYAGPGEAVLREEGWTFR